MRSFLSKMVEHTVPLVIVVLLMGGSAVAGGLITGSQIEDDSITGKDIKDGSLTAADFQQYLQVSGGGGKPGQGRAGPGPVAELQGEELGVRWGSRARRQEGDEEGTDQGPKGGEGPDGAERSTRSAGAAGGERRPRAAGGFRRRDRRD